MTMAGLEGIVVAETGLSDIDGEQGRLAIRGYPIEELAETRAFEEVCELLWYGRLPEGAERSRLERELGEARAEAFQRLETLGNALEASAPMDALRAALAHLFISSLGDRPDFTTITAAVAVFGAAWARRRSGHTPVCPDPDLPHAADYLRAVTGEAPGEAPVRALDAYLVTVAEHGMNASTFAARVVASTGSDAVSAVVSALGALKGPLHGGAPGPVLEMLDAIGPPKQARQWLEAELAAGRRIMGMGHRVYRTRDPRAAVLEGTVERLRRAGVSLDLLHRAREVERQAQAVLAERHPQRVIETNVEFYTAVLLDAVGLPRAMFTPTFAVARVAGWLAHIDEQWKRGRLMRPLATYVGP